MYKQYEEENQMHQWHLDDYYDIRITKFHIYAVELSLLLL